MPIPQLPTEILRAIMAEVGRLHWRGKPMASLSACCLVNKMMLSLAQEELYTAVDITITGQAADGSLLIRPEQLLPTILGNPRIAVIVKTVSITPQSHIDERQVRSTVETLMNACERADEFRWVGWDEGVDAQRSDWLEKLVVGQGRSLRSLRLMGSCPWAADTLVDTLRQLQLLRVLSLHSPPPQFADKPVLRLPFHLARLSMGGLPSPAALDLLLGASQDSLKHLHFGGFSRGNDYNFSTFTSLRTVTLTSNLSTKTPRDLISLFQALGTMPSLETLDVQSYTFGATRTLEEIHLLRLLPPSLLHIYADTGIRFSSQYLLDFLNDRTCLPLLQHLAVGRYVDHADFFADRTGDETETIKAAAGARGLRLAWGGRV